MLYDIYETETFSKLYESMEKEERERLNKIKVQIKENPNVGKPLKFEWFREKKFGNKRFYYLIYPTLKECFLSLSVQRKTSKRLLPI